MAKSQHPRRSQVKEKRSWKRCCTCGRCAEGQESPEKGREGRPWNQGQEGEDQREVLPSPNLPTSQSSEVPTQVDPKQEQDGCLQHYQAPSHHRVGHEEALRHQRVEGEHPGETNGRQESICASCARL